MGCLRVENQPPEIVKKSKDNKKKSSNMRSTILNRKSKKSLRYRMTLETFKKSQRVEYLILSNESNYFNYNMKVDPDKYKISTRMALNDSDDEDTIQVTIKETESEIKEIHN